MLITVGQLVRNPTLMVKMMSKIYGLKIYTRTTHEKKDGVYVPKMLGVIEGPINKMIKAYPKEFSFMRHETKRSLRTRGKK